MTPITPKPSPKYSKPCGYPRGRIRRAPRPQKLFVPSYLFDFKLILLLREYDEFAARYLIGQYDFLWHGIGSTEANAAHFYQD